MLTSINPHDGSTIKEYTEMTDLETGALLEQVQAAQHAWSRESISCRVRPLRRAAEMLREQAKELGSLMTQEMGKPVTEAIGEAEKCAWVCEYYADHAEAFLAREPIPTHAESSFISYQPLGVILGVMPWNFPFWQVFRFAAPTLAAGNGIALKHASNVSGCALAIQDLFKKAGFPENIFRTLLVSSGKIDGVIEHPLVAAVTLTGSTDAGKKVASRAGGHIKKTVLELGGSDPYIILDDADLDKAAAACAKSRMINSGQSCIAAKRFIVTRKNHEAFTDLLLEQMESYRMGNPLKEDTQVGPLARHDLRDHLHDQVKRSCEAGAFCLMGGEISDGPGAYYPPTVLDKVMRRSPASLEELFGPVAVIMPVDTEEEAVSTANDSPFGLGASVFTRDLARGEKLAEEQLQAGCCFVNDFVKSDPRVPFGGIKSSGYGRELSSQGIREFTNTKTVWISG